MTGGSAMTLTLRAATAEDASSLAEVFLASRQAFLPYPPLAHSEAEVQRWIREALIPSGGMTVACLDGRVVGMLAVSRAAGASWIDQLYVAPSSVGQGIGERLIDHALTGLPRPVRLYTFQANHRARRFFERHGFKPVAFTDGGANEERCPDVLYELSSPAG